MDDNSLTCYIQESGITTGENLDNEVITPNLNLGNTSGVNAIINVNSDEQSSNFSKDQLQDFLNTVMQAIRAESAKQTAAVQEESKKQTALLKAESAKLASAVENLAKS